MHVVVTVVFGQVDQDSCSAAAVPGPAEAAVADAPARRAVPLLMGGGGRPDESRLINTQTHHIEQRRKSVKLPNSAEHLGPPLRNGYGGRGRRTGPGPQRTPGSDSWSWCRLFSGGTGGKWIPEKNKIKSIFLKKKNTHSLVTNASTGLKQRGTHCGAVVHFLSHVVADVLQLRFCDVIHRSHHMKNSPGTVEGSTARLEITHTHCCSSGQTFMET